MTLSERERDVGQASCDGAGVHSALSQLSKRVAALCSEQRAASRAAPFVHASSVPSRSFAA
jgi:hypothetical protein